MDTWDWCRCDICHNLHNNVLIVTPFTFHCYMTTLALDTCHHQTNDWHGCDGVTPNMCWIESNSSTNIIFQIDAGPVVTCGDIVMMRPAGHQLHWYCNVACVYGDVLIQIISQSLCWPIIRGDTSIKHCNKWCVVSAHVRCSITISDVRGQVTWCVIWRQTISNR